MWLLNKIHVFLSSLMGELLKLRYQAFPVSIAGGLNTAPREERVVVSLTSYGRRVASVLPFAVYSLLRQTVKPDVIVLWLDEQQWSDDRLPRRIAQLRKAGLLTVNYCRDLRSYKKLVYALRDYADDVIITVDDDSYYRSNLIERLLAAHREHPEWVITQRAHRMRIDGCTVAPYVSWQLKVYGAHDDLVFPTGGGGCLYKRSMLYHDVADSRLFMRLSPTADDVWFFFMELLQATTRLVLPRDGYAYVPLDAFYQLFHRQSNLKQTNFDGGQNDVQIKAVMDYYHVTVADGRLRLPAINEPPRQTV